MDRTEISVRARVSKEHAAAVYELLEARSLWLREKGVAQWETVYPRPRFDREVEAGVVWCWRRGTEILATVTLLAERPDYYPDGLWPGAIPAWYVCRFATALRWTGQRLGSRLLAEIELDAAAAGISALRLDVVESNPFLARYYEDNGFVRMSQWDFKGASSILFEKRVVSFDGDRVDP
jgi:GNAT superfamily N-acetyltransferase